MTSCALTWLDHSTDGGLQKELTAKSRQGLALGVVPEDKPVVRLRFFDGREEDLALSCCAISLGGAISRNRIVSVDMSAAPTPQTIGRFPATIAAFGGQVVVSDARGVVLARSAIAIRGWIVSPSPSADQFAFLGTVLGHSEGEEGIYVAGFQEHQARRLMDVSISNDASIQPSMRPVIDWSSDGTKILFSYRGSIVTLDAQTGRSRKIAAGGAARWCPSGDWISYVSMKFEPSLLNSTTGESRVIDSGRGTGSPVEWSPDGRYLLIRETTGSHVPYGCVWVYRISDGAFVPVPYYGMAKPAPYWIQLGRDITTRSFGRVIKKESSPPNGPVPLVDPT